MLTNRLAAMRAAARIQPGAFSKQIDELEEFFEWVDIMSPTTTDKPVAELSYEQLAKLNGH